MSVGEIYKDYLEVFSTAYTCANAPFIPAQMHHKGSALVVLYSDDIETTQSKIESAGGAIVKPLFSFPGGRRSHFTDPNGNEYAVWSDINA